MYENKRQERDGFQIQSAFMLGELERDSLHRDVQERTSHGDVGEGFFLQGTYLYRES